MQTLLHLSDPFSLLASNLNATIPPKNSLSFPSLFRPQKTAIVCAASRRNRFAIPKSGKLMLESAYIIASQLRVLPEPVEFILRELGMGSGNGGRSGFWRGFGRGGSGGWGRRRKKMSLGMVGILVIVGAVGSWWIVGKELVLDSDTFLRVLGVVLFGLSAEGWRRGFKDWILGFFCCAFLVGMVSTKADIDALRRRFESLKEGWNKKKKKTILRFF